MTDEQPTGGTNGGILTAGDVTALVGLMSGMLDRMEGRIIGRLDDNSRLASERWVKHDQELEANTLRIVKRFEAIEGELLTVSNCLKGHLEREHDEDLVLQARVKPIQTTAQYITRHWRTAVVVLLALLGILGWTGIEAHVLGQ